MGSNPAGVLRFSIILSSVTLTHVPLQVPLCSLRQSKVDRMSKRVSKLLNSAGIRQNDEPTEMTIAPKSALARVRQLFLVTF